MLFSIIFIINVGIGTYSICFHWYLKKDVTHVNFGIHTQRFNKLINGRSQTNRDQKLYLLFLQRHDESQKFQLKFVKNRQKAVQRG